MSKRDRAREKEFLPDRLPVRKGQRLVEVFVEGYDDVAFWRGIFDDFESPDVTFEIAVPPRPDLAKGKRVVMDMTAGNAAASASAPGANSGSGSGSGSAVGARPVRLFCVDSDFDYIFAGCTPQSRRVINTPNVFHTYTYATENYLCWAPGLHSVCTRATKNDTRIFDFARFMEEYSRVIYPAFAWYAYSAQLGDEHIFKLIDFKNTVRLNYLDVRDNGAGTIEWLRGNVGRRIHSLEQNYARHVEGVERFKKQIAEKDVTPERTYLFMHGHTLLDNVVMPMLNAVCEKLKLMAADRIARSAQRGVAFANEVSNYRNALMNVRDTLVHNEDYKDCPLYRRLHADIAATLKKEGLL
ncbi:MAG: DUF4435 domain-containing protein [Alistipes sp.]|jgi:hypothetical protein|nr:DUF4435 domain-containing protein [Alistipes sp.]